MPLILIQTALIILWYAVPAVATAPWWVIFLPTLVPAVLVGGFFVVTGLLLLLAAILSLFSR